MVVPVLITNCQVLEKLKTGPVINQTKMTRKANINAPLLPEAFVTRVENFSKPEGRLDVLFFTSVN